MQQPQGRSTAGLTLPGKRSSVHDRVKWIEKTHGAGYPGPAAAPRAKLRLPKQFGEKLVEKAEETPISKPVEQPLSPVSDAAKSPTTISSDPAPVSVAKPFVSQNMPSPALSEVSTLETTAVAEPNAMVVSSTAGLQPLGHSRVGSGTDESIVSLQDDEDGLLYMSRNSSSSDLGGFALDPVHVRQGGQQQQQQHMPDRLSSADSASNRYERSAPTGNSSSKYKSLGGIRGRDRPSAARKFNRSQQQQQQQRESDDVESVHSVHSSYGGERAGSPERASSRGSVADDGSLLSRLNRRTSGRPKIQDLVSNRSSPKFVKRSHHYNATPVADHANGSISGSRYRGSQTQKRYI
ncbi:hypothetical protein LPJ57_002092 [Coemansia sp. RSA 486]|nr:hypothetical protein LPJ57_002092 [Coemansia sp. RSA 486]